MLQPITIAVPKGRILDELSPLFLRAGIDLAPFRDGSRRLIATADDGTRLILLRTSDVPTYVEYGVADVGVCGLDTLLESEADVLHPVDLGLGACRLSVAAPQGVGREILAKRSIKVATKYPKQARAYFRSLGTEPIIVKLYGSVELAAVAGLSDVIVDLVSTGKTLEANHLQELETIRTITSRLIVNRASLMTHHETIQTLITAVQGDTL
jgi:ATP phosphoribosyltransferase